MDALKELRRRAEELRGELGIDVEGRPIAKDEDFVRFCGEAEKCLGDPEADIDGRSTRQWAQSTACEIRMMLENANSSADYLDSALDEGAAIMFEASDWGTPACDDDSQTPPLVAAERRHGGEHGGDESKSPEIPPLVAAAPILSYRDAAEDTWLEISSTTCGGSSVVESRSCRDSSQLLEGDEQLEIILANHEYEHFAEEEARGAAAVASTEGDGIEEEEEEEKGGCARGKEQEVGDEVERKAVTVLRHKTAGDEIGDAHRTGSRDANAAMNRTDDIIVVHDDDDDDDDGFQSDAESGEDPGFDHELLSEALNGIRATKERELASAAVHAWREESAGKAARRRASAMVSGLARWNMLYSAFRVLSTCAACEAMRMERAKSICSASLRRRVLFAWGPVYQLEAAEATRLLDRSIRHVCNSARTTFFLSRWVLPR
jgi:hypothetical protein